MKNKRPRKTIGDAKYYHSTSFEILLHIMREVRHFSRIFLLLFLPVGEQIGVGDVCFFLTMRCFNDAMFSNS